MSEAFLDLGSRRTAYKSIRQGATIAKAREEYIQHPKLVTLGGDHSITLPALRALHQIYQQPIAVLHFDAHLDTWSQTPSEIWPSESSMYSHASVFWNAHQEGLLLNGSCVHAGLRTRLSGNDLADYESDTQQGWLQIEADDLDRFGAQGIGEMIMTRIGTDVPVYISVDIDVLDPAFAPGTGTPEVGGWSTRELIQLLRAVEGVNVVGADVVEVAPAYDAHSEVTSLAAAQIVYELLSNIVKIGLQVDGEIPLEESIGGRDEL